MKSRNRVKIGGWFLAVGASLAMLMKAYGLLNDYIRGLEDRVYPIGKVVFESVFIFLIGNWEYFIWIPWGAVFILYLLWMAVKIIRNKVNESSLGPMYLLGFWLFGALLYEYISYGFGYLKLRAIWLDSLRTLLQSL